MEVREEMSVPIARLFEIHEQPWFPQFLREQFVDSLQMILEVTNTYQPIASLLRKRLEENGSERVVDLCSGAGGPWPSLVRDFETHGAVAPEILLTDKYPSTTKLQGVESIGPAELALDRRSGTRATGQIRCGLQPSSFEMTNAFGAASSPTLRLK